MINSMLNRVAILKPALPQLNVERCHGKVLNVVSTLAVYNIELGAEGVTKFVLSMYINFAVLTGMVSRFMSKIVGLGLGTDEVRLGSFRAD
jgi:hypothetical protein